MKLILLILDSSDIFNTTQIQLLENLRFLIGEKDNNEKLGNQLANKGDVYILMLWDCLTVNRLPHTQLFNKQSSHVLDFFRERD